MGNFKKYQLALYLGFVASVGILFSNHVWAQVLPLNAQYFQNRYLANPSMAGIDQGFNINGSLRKQWSNIPGAPVTQSITLDKQADKIGWGVNIYNEKSGGLQRTKAVGTFAYHLPLNSDSQKLNFGISFGTSQDKLDLSSITNSDINDPAIARFNDRGYYLDGDFGLSYTSENLTVESAIPNLRSVFRKDDLNFVDKPTFYAAVSYRFLLGSDMNSVTLVPKGVVRGIKGFDSLWDAGLNATFINDKLSAIMMYHSTKNITFGIGAAYKSFLHFTAYYNMATAAIGGYTNGDFEINARVNIAKKQ